MAFIIIRILVILLLAVFSGCKPDKAPYEKYYSENFSIPDAKEMKGVYNFGPGRELVQFAKKEKSFKQTYAESCMFLDPYKKKLTFAFASVPGTFDLKIINYLNNDTLYIANENKEVLKFVFNKGKDPAYSEGSGVYYFEAFSADGEVEFNKNKEIFSGGQIDSPTLAECKEHYENALEVEGSYNVPRGPTD
ncbi:putative lipoprotein [Leptospira inadai serovar Lyme str. 10]|nr:putative lipoprotein [Leptospira inadai serovar Lyme str. 10]